MLSYPTTFETHCATHMYTISIDCWPWWSNRMSTIAKTIKRERQQTSLPNMSVLKWFSHPLDWELLVLLEWRTNDQSPDYGLKSVVVMSHFEALGQVECGPWLLQLFKSRERCGWGSISQTSLWPANNVFVSLFFFITFGRNRAFIIKRKFRSNLSEVLRDLWLPKAPSDLWQIWREWADLERDRKSSGQWNMKFTFTSPIAGQNNFNGRSSVSNCLLTWTAGWLSHGCPCILYLSIYSFHIGFFSSVLALLRCLFLWLINL